MIQRGIFCHFILYFFSLDGFRLNEKEDGMTLGSRKNEIMYVTVTRRDMDGNILQHYTHLVDTSLMNVTL